MVKSPHALRTGAVRRKAEDRRCLDATQGYRPAYVILEQSFSFRIWNRHALNFNFARNEDNKLVGWQFGCEVYFLANRKSHTLLSSVTAIRPSLHLVYCQFI